MNLFPPQPEWFEQALCAQTGPDDYVWFPNKGGSPRAAKDLCHGCPVIDECLQYAIDNDIRYGTWGATSERERARMTGRRSS